MGKSRQNSGVLHYQNLVPICGLCNKSMGTEDMREFMGRFGYGELKLIHHEAVECKDGEKLKS